MDMRTPPVDLRFCLSWASEIQKLITEIRRICLIPLKTEGMHLRTWHFTLSSKDLHLVGIESTTFSVWG